MTTMTNKSVTVLGITEDVNECWCCGKEDLKKTVALYISETEEVVYYGTTCAWYTTKWSNASDIELAHKSFKSIERVLRHIDKLIDTEIDVNTVKFAKKNLDKYTRSVLEKEFDNNEILVKFWFNSYKAKIENKINEFGNKTVIELVEKFNKEKTEILSELTTPENFQNNTWHTFVEKAMNLRSNLEFNYELDVNDNHRNVSAMIVRFYVALKEYAVMELKAKNSLRKMKKSNSEFVGNVGDKLELTLTVVSCKEISSFYGDSTMYKLEDSNGNSFVKFGTINVKFRTSTEDNFDNITRGDTISATFEIKDHKTFNNKNETTLGRLSSIKKVVNKKIKSVV